MHRILLGSILLCAAAAVVARADSVSIEGRPMYSNVEVFDADEGLIKFRSGRTLIFPVASVTAVRLEAQPLFNQAEKLLADGKAAEAAEAYEKAMETARNPWMQRLVRYRQLQTLNQAGRIDRAVEVWLSLTEGKPAEALIQMVPTQCAAKGDPANAAAIDLLKARLAEPATAGNAAYAAAVRNLLLTLLTTEGRSEEAERLATGETGTGPTDGTTPEDAAAASEAVRREQLNAAAFLLKQGKAAEALTRLDAMREQLGPGELPEALLLSGLARRQAAAAAAADKQGPILCQAGLDFMYVVAYFPDSAQAAEALYHAAGVCAELGNETAARKAYEGVVERYGRSEFAAKARQALARLGQDSP